MNCRQFTDILSRRSEHLQDYILRDVTPSESLIGFFESGRWPAQHGTSFTFDKFNRMYPDMAVQWSDVTPASCVGTPCDFDEVKVGFGFTRDMAKLQQIHYTTDLFCFDQIMSADRASQQFDHIVENLRSLTEEIHSNRLLNEQFRIAGHHWVCTTNGLLPFTWTETNDLTAIVLSTMPTSGLVANHLRRRLTYHMNSGYLGKRVKGMDMEIECLANIEQIWNMMEGDPVTTEHWRFESFPQAAKEYYKYGWTGHIGNFMVKALLRPQRWQIMPDGSLQRVFPYINIQATQGIKAVPNPAYDTAQVEAMYITHRRGFRNLVADSTSVNPNMPFASRDFGGKWQWVMHDLTCGRVVVTDVNGQNRVIPIPVDNTRGNKGKFVADFKMGTEAQFPEYIECFLYLRALPCVVATSPCGLSATYVEQDYSSSNTPCCDQVPTQGDAEEVADVATTTGCVE